MAYDLTLVNAPTFNNSGKYGKSFATGRGVTSNVFVGLLKYTLEAWVKTSSSGSIIVATGSGGCAWLGMVADGRSRGSYGNGTGRDLHGPVINDGAWHHLALTVSDATGGVLYVDGVSAATAAATDAPVAADFGVRYFGGATFDWIGEVDEVAVTSGVKYTGNFTPGPVANNQANLIGVWHLEGDGINSAGLAAPAVTAPGAPTIGAVAVGNGSASVSGTAPSSDGGSPITEYTATAYPSGITGVSATLPVNVSGLTNGVAQTFKLKARNVPAGYGPESAASASVTPTAGNNAPTFPGASIANISGTAGTAITPVNVSSLFSDTDTLTYSASPNGTAWPAGLVINSATGVISGTIAAAGTTTGLRVRATDTASQSVDSNAFNAAIADAAGNALDTTKMLFSPGNWNLAANSARAINAGAYFSTLFTGTSCKLQFDMTGVTAPSTCYYQIDNGPMTEFTVAANVVLTVPTATAQWADKGGHILRVIIKQRNPGAAVWFNSAVMVALTGIVLDTGKVLLLPANKRNLSLLVEGDSLTEAQVTVDSTGNGDATLGYAYALRDLLGAEVGVIGFGGQGWTVTGGGGSPIFPTTYNKIYDGVARSFAGVDAILINHGTNDPVGTDITATATGVLNGYLADATLPAGCKIIVMRPFNGAHGAQLQAAIAACSNPARITYMDTTNFFNTANAHDGLHPYGNESSTHIAPQVATSIRAILAGAPALTQRTFTVQLATGKNADQSLILASNMQGLKVSHHDGLPNSSGVARYESDSETTDGNGYLTYSCACASANGHVTVLGPGLQYNAAVVAS